MLYIVQPVLEIFCCIEDNFYSHKEAKQELVILLNDVPNFFVIYNINFCIKKKKITRATDIQKNLCQIAKKCAI